MNQKRRPAWPPLWRLVTRWRYGYLEKSKPSLVMHSTRAG